VKWNIILLLLNKILYNFEKMITSQDNQNSLSEDKSMNHMKMDVSESISGISENEEEIDLNNLDSLIVEKKPQVYNDNRAYEFSKIQERADVYIKNYLMKFDMLKSLRSMEQEFFELLSKGEININSIPNVPPVYIQSEIFQEKISNIQKELDDAKIYAEKANSLFLKLKKAKENEKIKHRRVQQEKQILIKEINKMKFIYEEDNGIYQELRKKYTTVTQESMLLEQRLKTEKSKMENINDQIEKMKKTLDEAKKQKERI
jgi:hypothetical protein